MAVVFSGLFFSLFASAQDACLCNSPKTTEVICISAPVDGSIVRDLDATINIPKFDKELGCLQSVRVTAESCGYLIAKVDSESLLARTWDIIALSGVRVTIPFGLGNQLVQFGTTEGAVQIDTEPDDEPGLNNADFEGPDSGIIDDFGSPDDLICSVEKEFIFTSEADKQLFIGSEGETIPIKVEEVGEIRNEGGAGSVDFRKLSELNAKVCVEYTYCPKPHLCINGTKINDCTGAGIEGWEICLTKPDGETICTQTDANGDYSFCELDPGDYTVTEETRDGWVPKDSISRDVNLIDANEDGVDFHNEPLSCISGHKFNSKTNAGVSGWTIDLKDSTGTVIKTTTTGTGGYYEFCGLENGDYTVCERTKSGWKPIGPTCIDVTLDCANSENNDFYNEPTTLVCVCPFFIKNDLYGANIREVKVVDASKGILENDPAGSIVLNPESITIDPKFGTLTVDADGSFVYDPTVATGRLYSGQYVIFKYTANNGLCDSQYPGIAKIQLRK